MAKKCIVCDSEAKFKIKDTSDYYCKDCALENFGDLEMLQTIEEEAQRLKEYIKEKLSGEINDVQDEQDN